jgi:hypothetical protein
MWSRALRASRRQLAPAHCFTQPRRTIGGQSGPQQPHTTYFQQPPQPPKQPRRILRNVLWSSFCFTAGAITYIYALGLPSDLLAELQGISAIEISYISVPPVANSL